MLNNYIEINNCKHYFANELCDDKLLYINNPYAIEEDTKIKHPLGVVYKAKGVIDTPVRFVIQPNKTILFFNTFDWFNDRNPFTKLTLDWIEEKIEGLKKYFAKKEVKPKRLSYVSTVNWQ